MSFSMQMIYMFDEAEVEIADLLPDDAIQAIRQAIGGKRKTQTPTPKLRFTDLRNKYMHEGFHTFIGREREAVDLIRNMRALAERLLMKYMGIDYKSTSLGEPSLF